MWLELHYNRKQPNYKNINLKKKFIPIITHLNNGRGHVLDYHLYIKSILKKKISIYPIIFFDKKIKNLNFKKKTILNNYFTNLTKDQIFKKNLINIVLISLKEIFRLKKELEKIKLNQNSKNIIFIESFNPIQLIGILLYFKKKEKHNNLYLYAVHRGSINQGKGLYNLYSKFFHYIFKVFLFNTKKKRIKFFSDSEIICKELKRFYSMKINHLPVPLLGYKKKFIKKDYLILPGEPRLEKGLDTFLFLHNYFQNDFKFFVSKKIKKIKKLKNLNYFGENLDKKKFMSNIIKSEIAILAYDTNIYKSATSGIFINCVELKTIPLVNDGTWMAYICKQYDIECLVMKNKFEYYNFLNKYKNNQNFKSLIFKKFDKFRNAILKNYSKNEFLKNLEI